MKRYLCSFAVIFTIFLAGAVFAGEVDNENKKNPVMLKIVDAAYPSDLKEAGVEGKLTVGALVLSDGSIGEVKIHKTSGYEQFDKSALEAAKLCEFNPGSINDKPVAMWIVYTVTFTLMEQTIPGFGK